MNVLLIKHPTTHFSGTSPAVSGMPLGLLYVAASLKKAGHTVRIYDAIVEADESRWGYSVLGGIYQMGATWKEFKAAVDKLRPDVVGIANQYSSQVMNTLKAAEAIKELSRDIKVIVGGAHPSVMPEDFFRKNNYVDYVVMGEGEATAPELLESLEGKKDIKTVKGIAYISNGELVVHEKRG